MKTKFWMGWAAGLCSVLLLVGCSEESTPGGPGASTTTQSGEPANDDATFTFNMPTGATNVKQGESKTIKIDVDRGDDFKDAVTLSIMPPDGIKVEPKEATIPAGSDSVEIAVQVDPTVPAGEKIIDISGKGGSGPAATGQLKIEVTQADGADNTDNSNTNGASSTSGASGAAATTPPANPNLNPAPTANPANPEGGAPPQNQPNP